jgi:hypothetical protein
MPNADAGSVAGDVHRSASKLTVPECPKNADAANVVTNAWKLQESLWRSSLTADQAIAN